MRSLVTYAVTALAVLGLPVAGYGQRAASTTTSLGRCDWQPIGQFSHLAPRALAATPDGGLLLAADDLTDSAHSTLVTLRWDPAAASWQEVDRYLPDGSTATGARALHVDADGNAYVLAWERRDDGVDLLLRRSFGAGVSGTWESSEARWPAQAGGALGSDPDGRLYVAYGFADPTGIGWRLESALRGIGAFAVEDVLRVSGVVGAMPQAIARTDNGSLYVAGQLDGAPDQWLVRARTGGARKAAWRTIDRYKLSPTSYGLSPRAVVPLADGRLLVAGLGVRGGGSDDYEWIERWQGRGGNWQTRRYQLQSGLTTMALDAAATASGVAVLGIGSTISGVSLVLRETSNSGADAHTVLQLSGVSDLWSARLAIGSRLAAVAASVDGEATVVGCALH